MQSPLETALAWMCCPCLSGAVPWRESTGSAAWQLHDKRPCCCLTTCASAAGPRAGARTNLRFLNGLHGRRRRRGAPRPSGPSAAYAG